MGLIDDNSPYVIDSSDNAIQRFAASLEEGEDYYYTSEEEEEEEEEEEVVNENPNKLDDDLFPVNVERLTDVFKEPTSEDDPRSDYYFAIEKIGTGQMTYKLMDDVFDHFGVPQFMSHCRKLMKKVMADWNGVGTNLTLKYCPCLTTVYYFAKKRLKTCPTCSLPKTQAFNLKYGSVRSFLIAIYTNKELMKRIKEVRKPNNESMSSIFDGNLFKESLQKANEDDYNFTFHLSFSGDGFGLWAIYCGILCALILTLKELCVGFGNWESGGRGFGLMVNSLWDLLIANGAMAYYLMGVGFGAEILIISTEWLLE